MSAALQVARPIGLIPSPKHHGLKWDELGVLGYMAAHPAGYRFSFAEILEVSREKGHGASRDALYRIMKGLRQAGCVRFDRVTHRTGRVIENYYTVTAK